MGKLMEQVANKFGGNIIDANSVSFNFGDDAYVVTDGAIYAVTDEGDFLPGFKRVKNILAIENFVAARA